MSFDSVSTVIWFRVTVVNLMGSGLPWFSVMTEPVVVHRGVCIALTFQRQRCDYDVHRLELTAVTFYK